MATKGLFGKLFKSIIGTSTVKEKIVNMPTALVLQNYGDHRVKELLALDNGQEEFMKIAAVISEWLKKIRPEFNARIEEVEKIIKEYTDTHNENIGQAESVKNYYHHDVEPYYELLNRYWNHVLNKSHPKVADLEKKTINEQIAKLTIDINGFYKHSATTLEVYQQVKKKKI